MRASDQYHVVLFLVIQRLGLQLNRTADELLEYWPELVCLEANEDIANGPPKFREAGLDEMFELVWRSP